MPSYRLYTLTPDGHINSRPVEGEYVDDAEAIADARKRLHESVIEIWQGARRVAAIYPRAGSVRYEAGRHGLNPTEIAKRPF